MKVKHRDELLTIGGHLEELRKMLFHVIGVAFCIAMIVFVFKRETFDVLLAPSEWDFVTYRGVQKIIQKFSPDFHFDEYHVDLIATDLSSQFMTHITTALYLGLLVASPYILYEIFRFTSPALYENERSITVKALFVIYILFVIGVLMSYFVLFPISFRFLGTYSVADRVHSTITLDSYISTFVTLTLMMGVIFQLPVITYALGKMGIINATSLIAYRKHAIIAIALISAIITPPDLMTLILVAVPLYLLYEVSIWILLKTQKNG